MREEAFLHTHKCLQAQVHACTHTLPSHGVIFSPLASKDPLPKSYFLAQVTLR